MPIAAQSDLTLISYRMFNSDQLEINIFEHLTMQNKSNIIILDYFNKFLKNITFPILVSLLMRL